MKKLSRKAIQFDHKSIVKIKEIEQQQTDICSSLSAELGFDTGWLDTRELAAGMSPYQLWRLQKD